MTANPNGQIKLINKRQEKYYRAEIRLGIEPRFSRRSFRTASQADAYGKAWAERYNRFVAAASDHQNDSMGLSKAEGS